MDVEALLRSTPPLMVYLVVGAVVGIESLGIPLPGEIVLVSAAVLSSHPELAVNPIGVGGAAVIGAVVGDSIGYSIGRRFGLRYSTGWAGGSQNTSAPVMSRLLNGCSTDGESEPCSSVASSRCCGYSPDRSLAP
ncbi:transmembrane protein DEDA [Mycobacterium tuberculosis]|nr:transmembrane protein DEDA [Mycobacterium tuberculosis]